MGHKITKEKLKYAILNKITQQISILSTQKEVAELFKVDRKTIYRGLPYENEYFVCYIIANVPKT